jgi:hypothetical protein
VSTGDTVPSRETVLSSINKRDFLEFYHGLVLANRVNDPAWSLLPNPYAWTPTVLNNVQIVMDGILGQWPRSGEHQNAEENNDR